MTTRPEMTQLNLYDQGFLIQGMFHIVRRRWLLAWLKGCDARLYHSAQGCSRDAKYVLAGEGTPGEVYALAAQRGMTVLHEDELLEPLRIEWSVDERLVALRGLLNQPPSAEVWRQVCQELELWPASQGLEIGLAYVQGVTRGWPDEVMLGCAMRWIKRAAADHADVRMAVVRDLCISGHAGVRLKALGRMMDRLSPELRSIRLTHPFYSGAYAGGQAWSHAQWGMARVSVAPKELELMLTHPHAARVRHIDLSGATLVRGCAEVLARHMPATVETLNVQHAGYQRKDLDKIPARVALTV